MSCKVYSGDLGQGVLEYAMALIIIFVVLIALLSVWDGYRRDAVKPDSMLGETFLGAPYTNNSSLGLSSQGARDVLSH